MEYDYRIVSELYRSDKRVVYRGERLNDYKPVIIKSLLGHIYSNRDVLNLKREYEILNYLRLPGIVQVYGFEKVNDIPSLILDDIGGITLREMIDSEILDLEYYFKIAIQLSSVLADIHKHNIIHKDINPKNIVVNPKTLEICLIDFSLSSSLQNEIPQLGHHSLLQGTLSYISPEQTGRMNRSIDYRTDYYSLGITMYEMLCGMLPFHSDDVIELVHMHLAKTPVPPHEIKSTIPSAISKVIMKLISKNPEDRYESAYGIQSDLEECYYYFQNGESADNYVPGKNDFSERFIIPQKLYGRDPEISKLIEAFDSVRKGNSEFTLVSGYSGIGKTSLINEIHKPMVRHKGYFISGKFDQFKRNIPYSAFIQAFRELLRQLLTENESQINIWREKLLTALGKSGQIIIDVIPEVEHIIGEQPPVQELPPTESQNRFNLIFARFVQVFSQREHPLVIFLDDLQWADTATFKLLDILLTDINIKSLLIIGSYRDNEVSDSHPLVITISELDKKRVIINRINLGPLDIDDLDHFISDTLNSKNSKTHSITSLIKEKTGGNPFFVIQFLKALFDEGIFHLNRNTREWQYDLDTIRKTTITDNVVDLMVSKIHKLPEDTRDILKTAACLGNEFDLETLVIVNEQTPSVIAGKLLKTVHEGLVVPLSEFEYITADITEDYSLEDINPSITSDTRVIIFKFLHDRVQQAVYSLIPHEEKSAIHLKCGRSILMSSTESELEEKLFDVVNNLNQGSALIKDQSEVITLAGLNLRAGLKAKMSTAYRPAIDYLNRGLELLGKYAEWNNIYDLLFSLYRQLAECEYLCGNFEMSDELFDLLLNKAATNIEKAEIYYMKVIQYENMALYQKSIQSVKEGLKLLSIDLPENETDIINAFETEVELINRNLKSGSIQDLSDLPVMTDVYVKMSMKLLMSLWAPAYIAAEVGLTRWLSAKMVNLSLSHGNTEESAVSYVIYGLTLGVEFGDYKSGYDYGILAINVNEKFKDVKYKAKVHHIFSCHINFWTKPIVTCFPHSKQAYQSGLENGDFVYAAYALIHESWNTFLSGYELNQFIKDYSSNVSFLEGIKNYSFARVQQFILQWAHNLQGHTGDIYTFSDDDFDENEYIKDYSGDAFFEIFYLLPRMHTFYLYGRTEEAYEVSESVETIMHALHSTFWDHAIFFYIGLIIAELYDKSQDREKKKLISKLNKIIGKFKIWSDNSPENFNSHYMLLLAESCRIGGEHLKAMDLYQRSIESARKNGYINIEALANELFGSYWVQRENKLIGGLFITQAYNCYKQWGANVKAQRLKEVYKQCFNKIEAFHADTTPNKDIGLSTVGIPFDTLDLRSVIKSSQLISGEILLGALVDKLIAVVIECAGADKGFLILEKNGIYTVEAYAEIENSELKLQSLAYDEPENYFLLPSKILNYVKRTRESLLWSDTEKENRFSGDEYLKTYRPRSIICVPVIIRGELSRILYLENNLTSDAFTRDRLELVKILSSQASISLLNAELYEEMRIEIKQRIAAEEALKSAMEEVEKLKDRLQIENTYLQEEIKSEYNFEEIIGKSDSIRKVFVKIQQVALTGATVLITGETGTGKELVARAVHNLSNRNSRPLVKVNCGAISESLVESELFGHEKGAFTGALERRIGRFELADGGTIFLDEIGEISPEVQVKLLRVLQEGEFERVGSSDTIKVDVRIITATNRDLSEAVNNGAFRSDLYYRLNVYPVEVPPLRERKADIILLANYFLSKFSKKLNKNINAISTEVLDYFMGYSWPGNIRELQNVVERATVLSNGGVITLEHIFIVQPPGEQMLSGSPESESESLEDVERDHIISVLKHTGWIIDGNKGAARILKINPNTLRSRMQKLGIKKPTAM